MSVKVFWYCKRTRCQAERPRCCARRGDRPKLRNRLAATDYNEMLTSLDTVEQRAGILCHIL